MVGTVLERHGETYSVNINGPAAATLPILAFEAATVGSLGRFTSSAGCVR